mgnify:CR=1 FL=1
MRRACLTALVVLVAATRLPAGTAPVPWPPGGSPPLVTFVTERDGSIWALSSSGGFDPLYCTGESFRPLAGGNPPGMTCRATILGDAVHGYYLPRFENEPPVKRIYRLIDGTARLHCEPLPTGRNDNELTGNTYVAHDGRVVSWNGQRLALWFRDAWTFHPVSIPDSARLPIAIEHAGHIVLVGAQEIHVIDPDGAVTTRRPNWSGTTRACFQWQGAVALRMVEEEAGVEAFDLLRGNRLPLPPPLARMDEPAGALFRSSAGTVWAQTAKAVYRLDGKERPARFDLPAADISIEAIDEGGKADADGAPRWNIFFTDALRPGLWRWNADGTEQWDARHGIPKSAWQVRITADRTLLFLASTPDDVSLFRLPLDPPVPPPETDPQRWHQIDLHPATRPMELGGTVACIPAEAKRLLRWDGAAWSEQSWADAPEWTTQNRVAWDDRGTVYCLFNTDERIGDPLVEFTPEAVTLVNDGSRRDYNMLEALQRSAGRGATRFMYGDDVTKALITPQRHLWMGSTDQYAVRHHDGTLWLEIPCGGVFKELSWNPRDGVVLHLHNGETRVYRNGLFEILTGPTNAMLLRPLPEVIRSAVSLPPGELAQTPLAGRAVHKHFADAAGNLWFWLRQKDRVCILKLDDLRLTAGADPLDTQPDCLKITASAMPAPDKLGYAYRLDGADEWIPLPTPRGAPARLRFPQSGVHTCEVAAVVYGVRLPRTVTFTHTVSVTPPDTRLLVRQDEMPQIVTETDWRPPVEAVPSAFASRSVCRVVWREASSDNPWRPLPASGRFPLNLLATNGLYHMEFAAREENIQIDPSPVRLSFRLALDDEGMLLLALDNLASGDPEARLRGGKRLIENGARWRPLLNRMLEQSHNARATLDTLSQLNDELRKQGF